MKKMQMISILVSASLAVTCFAGCKKSESEEPVIIYYSEGQQDPAAVTITLQEGNTQGGGNETEPLAPIIADRSTSDPSTTVAAETSETSLPSETILPNESEESAALTTETTAATTASQEQPGAVPALSGSHINDGAGVIADEASLNSAMASFESDTGISPAIFTISDQLSGDDFRQYARDIYNTNFSDQDHVLIVYQVTPQGTWSWTCVFGSNTGTVFSQDNIDEFQTNLTNAFSSSNVDNALVTTFTAAENYNN